GREEDRRAAVGDEVADGRHRVVDGDRRETKPAQLERALSLDLVVVEEGVAGVGDPLEVGPDLVVEDVDPERGDRLPKSVYMKGFRTNPDVEEEGDRGDMVRVGVGDDDALQGAHLVDGERR